MTTSQISRNFFDQKTSPQSCKHSLSKSQKDRISRAWQIRDLSTKWKQGHSKPVCVLCVLCVWSNSFDINTGMNASHTSDQMQVGIKLHYIKANINDRHKFTMLHELHELHRLYELQRLHITDFTDPSVQNVRTHDECHMNLKKWHHLSTDQI